MPSTLSVVEAAWSPDVPMDIEWLLHRFDREREAPRGNADRDLVAFLLSDQRATHGRVDGDAACRRIALHRPDQVVRLRVPVVIDDLDGRARPGHARAR